MVVCLWGPAASVFDPTRAGVRGDATATRGACATLPYEAMHSIEVINRVGSRCGLVFVEKKTWRHCFAAVSLFALELVPSILYTGKDQGKGLSRHRAIQP